MCGNVADASVTPLFGEGGGRIQVRVVLNGKKKVFQNQFSQKSPRALHVLNHGWWRLAVGGWRRLAVGSWQLAVGGGWWRLVVVGGGWWLVIGGWWRLAVVGSCRLVAVGGWRRLVAGGWRRLVVGGWWRLAVDGSWRLAVGGPLGRSLRAVLSKKKKSGPLRTALIQVEKGELPLRVTPRPRGRQNQLRPLGQPRATLAPFGDIHPNSFTAKTETFVRRAPRTPKPPYVWRLGFRVCALVRVLGGHCRRGVSRATGDKCVGWASGTVVPELTSAAAAPRRPSPAGAGNASHSDIPTTAKTWRAATPQLMWAVYRAFGET